MQPIALYACGDGGVSVGIGCFVDKLKELVELRSDYDLGAPVELTPLGITVARNRIVFATATGGEARRVDAEFILKRLNNRRGSERRQIPVVADIGL